MFWAEIWKKKKKKKNRIFYLKSFNFFVVKLSVYLNRRVFVMLAWIFIHSFVRSFLALSLTHNQDTSTSSKWTCYIYLYFGVTNWSAFLIWNWRNADSRAKKFVQTVKSVKIKQRNEPVFLITSVTISRSITWHSTPDTWKVSVS